ncbi:hypothetical protein PHLGIDRAFT_517210, partial [Phlebiopsis gigantea 11061_1 CR5-6]
TNKQLLLLAADGINLNAPPSSKDYISTRILSAAIHPILNSPLASEISPTSAMSTSFLTSFAGILSSVLSLPPDRPPAVALDLDVLEVILDFVQGDGPFDFCHPERRTVLALALTNKAYTYTCLARLWRNIPNLWVLDRVLDTEHGKAWLEEIIHGRNQNDEPVVSVACGGVLGDAGTRMCTYLSMINRLGWHWYNGSLLSALNALIAQHQDDRSPLDLFPSLRYIDWVDGRQNVPWVAVFARPERMRCLSLAYNAECETVLVGSQHTRYVARLLRFLHERNIFPQSLAITFFGPLQQNGHPVDWASLSAEFAGAIQGLVPLHHELTELAVYPSALQPPHIRESPGIPVLRNLTTLGFELHDAPDPAALSLPVLRVLEVRFVAPQPSCVDFMRTLDCPNLGSLCVLFGVSGSWDAAVQHRIASGAGQASDTPTQIFVDGIRCSNYFHTVHSFELTPPGTRHRRMESALVDAVLQHPLPNVVSLALDTTRYRQRSLSFVPALHAAYPHLESLRVSRPPHTRAHAAVRHPVSATLEDVQLLVAGLPRLTTLRMAFSPSGLHGRWTLARPPGVSVRRCGTLTDWDVLDARLCMCRCDELKARLLSEHLRRTWWDNHLEERLESVAMHIRGAFPLLARMSGGGSCEVHAGRWQVVFDRVARGLEEALSEDLDRGVMDLVLFLTDWSL